MEENARFYMQFQSLSPRSWGVDGHGQYRLRVALLAWLVALGGGRSSGFTPRPLVTAAGSDLLAAKPESQHQLLPQERLTSSSG